MLIDCAGKPLDLSQPQVMGLLNVTPDSFSDGGRFLEPERAVARAQEMADEGAALIDVGGESTRPGAEAVPVAEELARVIPVIEALAGRLEVPVSIDTMKPEVMRAAVAAGAGLINDVNALRAPGALDAAIELGVPVCLMHMQGEPRSMQQNPVYTDVVAEVKAFLAERIGVCEAAGLPRERLIADPGFGFGKTLEHNLQLMRGLHELNDLAVPLLVGVSRKSMIGAVVDVPAAERVYGGVALAALAVWQGAAIIRTHDVRATVQAVRMTQAVKNA